MRDALTPLRSGGRDCGTTSVQFDASALELATGPSIGSSISTQLHCPDRPSFDTGPISQPAFQPGGGQLDSSIAEIDVGEILKLLEAEQDISYEQVVSSKAPLTLTPHPNPLTLTPHPNPHTLTPSP